MIPTAEEFLKEYGVVSSIDGSVTSLAIEAMIEFAKLHVQAALKAAANKAMLNAYDRFGKCLKKEYYSDEGEVTINGNSIINSYPLETIK